MAAQPRSPTRSLTVLVVRANTPDEIDAMSWSARREGAWTRLDLVHPGEPDVLLRRTLDLDQGVYGSPRAWDDDDSAVVVTSLITRDHLEFADALLEPHVADPMMLADRLVRAAGDGEDRERVARALVEQLSEPAVGRAEEAAAYVRIFRANVPAAREQQMGIAWESRTPAPCSCAVWDGMTNGDIRAFPRSQFVTLTSVETGDAWRAGRLRCTRCRATFQFISTSTYAHVTREPPRSTLELGADEIQRVIAGIRDGMQVVIGGSRLHTTYLGRNGELFIEDFDEGVTSERACPEAELQAMIAGGSAEFLEVLRRPLREVLCRTLVGLSAVSPHEALRDLLVYGDCLSHRRLLEVVIDWPDAASVEVDAPILSAAAEAELATLKDGVDVYHFIRSSVGYEASTPATGRFGLRVFAALAEMLGRELPGWRRWRSEFRAMAGDVEGAIEDLAWERARLPKDDDDRPYLERAMAKLADASILAQIAATPDDDAPRLVWADLLTERGDPRGELIVAQCRIAGLHEDDPERELLTIRVEQLLAQHGRAWGKRGYRWDRGFVEGIEVRWGTYAANLDEAFALSPPLQGLYFRSYRNEVIDDPARVLDDPRLERLTILDFKRPVFAVDGPDGETLERFGDQIVRRLAGRFPDLRELGLRGAQLSIEEVGSIGPRDQLQTLDLGEVALRAATGALFGAGGASRFTRLKDLRLDHCQLADDDVAPLTRLPSLKHLDLGGNPIGVRGARTLAKLGVERLQLGGIAIGDGGVAALASASGLAWLDISNVGVGNVGVAALAELELVSLDLGENRFDEMALGALARGRVAKTLRRLVVGPCVDRRLGPEIVRSLASLPLLRRLLLRDCELGADGAIALLDALPELRGMTLAAARSTMPASRRSWRTLPSRGST